jgi:hypothetical protein
MAVWRFRGFVAALSLAAAMGCDPATLQLEEVRCPEAVGEFPPDGCARLRGTLIPPVGQAASGFVLAVDTTDAESESWFVASPARVPENGRFELLVVQVRPLGSPPVPARTIRTIDVRVYRNAAEARDRTPPRLADPVAMVFGRWGEVVTYTDVVLRVPD